MWIFLLQFDQDKNWFFSWQKVSTLQDQSFSCIQILMTCELCFKYKVHYLENRHTVCNFNFDSVFACNKSYWMVLVQLWAVSVQILYLIGIFRYPYPNILGYLFYWQPLTFTPYIDRVILKCLINYYCPPFFYIDFNVNKCNNYTLKTILLLYSSLGQNNKFKKRKKEFE